MQRKQTRPVRVGSVIIGGDAPIAIQSMTTTDTRDVASTVAQIHQLENAGCEIVRVAVPDEAAAAALGDIKRQIHIPLVADIHFNHQFALTALKAGVDKLRINPGNIGSRDRVEAVASAAAERNVPIRIGANVGSIDKKRYGEPSPETLAASALDQVKILEDVGFEDIVLSLKAFDVPLTVEAYRIVSQAVPYPLHLGITESGLPWEGTIRSAVGIGALLAEGIGDTLRVSLTGDPIEEVIVGAEILSALNLRSKPYTIVSCPTCGRCEIDLKEIANEVRQRLAQTPPSRPMKIAVMGCVVNGPGEAEMADVGIAGGAGIGLIFARGKMLRRVPETQLVDELMKEIKEIEHNT